MRFKPCFLCGVSECGKAHREVNEYLVFYPDGHLELNKTGKKKLGEDYLDRLRKLSTPTNLQKSE